MTQKMKSMLCALLITAFSAGAFAATEAPSFAASHTRAASKTTVAKKRRRRSSKKGNQIVQTRRHKSGKKTQAPLPLVPGSADPSNA